MDDWQLFKISKAKKSWSVPKLCAQCGLKAGVKRKEKKQNE